ncbi:MAG: CPBP family glutamic-type intramembrane protease [Candidatus Binataceae bacterium]
MALVVGVAAAVVLAPLAADGVARAGFRIPFPRIFDRVVTATLAAAMLLLARRLELVRLLREGFGEPRRNLSQLLVGIGVALAVMAALFAVAIAIAHPQFAIGALGLRVLRYSAAALLIGLLEEAFFRAILLGGMVRDFGRRAALTLSAAIYALAHLVRSPRHYYLTGLHATAGFENLVASLARIAHPDGLIAMTLGLFLLGLVLGAAFLVTGRAYLSVGLHAGFVIGAKCWPLVAAGATPIPRWLAGPGPVPLIAAPAAWIAALALLAVIAPAGRASRSFLSNERTRV